MSNSSSGGAFQGEALITVPYTLLMETINSLDNGTAEQRDIQRRLCQCIPAALTAYGRLDNG